MYMVDTFVYGKLTAGLLGAMGRLLFGVVVPTTGSAPR
jgi:hypothetical protein